jgi:hypothetical protein
MVNLLLGCKEGYIEGDEPTRDRGLLRMFDDLQRPSPPDIDHDRYSGMKPPLRARASSQTCDFLAGALHETAT